MLLKINDQVLRSVLETVFDAGVDCGYQDLGESDLGKLIPPEKRIDRDTVINGAMERFVALEKEKAKASVSDRELDKVSGTVTVCDHCLRASCWLGLSYCDDYKTAGTIEITREELVKLDLENPDYWDYGNRV